MGFTMRWVGRQPYYWEWGGGGSGKHLARSPSVCVCGFDGIGQLSFPSFWT